MSNESDKDGHFANYAEYSKTLRSWLVAYGIGGPVLFLTNKDAPAKLAGSPHLDTIVTLFLVGVGFQIFLAFINKWAAWHMYKAGVTDDYQSTLQYKTWYWINDQSWIDCVFDLIALASFSAATWLILKVMLGS